MITGRGPLDVAAVVLPDGWRLVALDETGSTNTDAAEAARAGEPHGLVVVAEVQTAGRGRLDRAWTAPRGAALTFSVLLRPVLPVPRWGWVPLSAGVAVHRAVGVPNRLKWPNDVLAGDAKLAGILAEVPAPGAVVVGIGINCTTTADELPAGVAATSVAMEGGEPDRARLLTAVLAGLVRETDVETDTDAYRAASGTIGRRVAVEMPGGRRLVGTAVDVDGAGRLLVDGPDGVEAVAAGDVVHLRAV